MNAISVGYRFSREELSTLLQALRIEGLPGAPLVPVDEGTAQRVLERLSGDGIAMIAEETLYVDKLIDFLLRTAAGARRAVALTDGSRTAVLWQAERLLILGDFPAEGECALTPLQDERAARAALADTAVRLSRPLWAMSVFDPDRRITVAADSPLTEEQIARETLALMEKKADPADESIFS